MYSHKFAPTKRQVRSRSGKTLRHQAHWRYMGDASRYDFPVTVTRIQATQS